MRYSLEEQHKEAVVRCGLGPAVSKKDLVAEKLEKAAMQDWLSRLSGGPGCWKVNKSWFTSKYE